MAVAEQIRHRIRRAGGIGLEPLAQLGVFSDQPTRPGLVMEAIHLLAGMAEGAMPNVMEQGGGIEHAHVGLELRGHALEPCERLARQLQHPQRMGEAARFRPMEGEVGGAQLADAAQALEGGRVDQVDGQGFSRIAALQADRPMQGVVVRALTHVSAPSGVSSLFRWLTAASSQLSPLPPGSRGSGSGSSRSGSMPRFWMSRPLGVT